MTATAATAVTAVTSIHVRRECDTQPDTPGYDRDTGGVATEVR